MVRDDDDFDADDATKNASMLQNKQLMTNNVILKRKEQLSRWQTSEMNGEPTQRRKKPRVQFQDGDIFLSACMSGDEEEVDDLLSKGADINTSTVDGLTALHQSVIDSKPDMVQFLCDKGADMNAQDNEGWTPLHAAACCGNLNIVKYLCQNGADLAIINSDKELALDLADDEACREFLELEYRRRGIEPEKCRNQELSTMLRDAQKWMRDGKYGDAPHHRTGATAMHVAAAKGYTQILELLIKAGGNVRAADKDGWTPLHAAAHWGERDSCKILMEHGASVNDLNYAGQNVLIVADNDIVEYLEDLDRTVDKRRTTPSSITSVLQEKNNRINMDDNGASTNEHKREHKEQSSETEPITPTPKFPKLSEKTPSIDSQSSDESRRSQASDEATPEKTESEAASSARSSEEPSISVSERSSMSVDNKSVDSQRSSVVSSTGTTNSVSPSSGSTSSNVTRSTTATSSSLQSGDQHITATVPIPRPVQQAANSWINRGVQLITRSASSSSGNGSRSSQASTEGSSQATSQASSNNSNSSSTVAPYSPTSTTAAAVPSFASKTMPWQSTNNTNESEAERRSTARLQRQSRRSTQGVTKEQLEEASRMAAEDTARRRGSSNTMSSIGSSETSHRSSGIQARLASEERDSISVSDRDSVDGGMSTTVRLLQDGSVVEKESDRSSTDRYSPPNTSATLSLSKVPSVHSTPSAASLRRKSQGVPLSRSNRRGTGPVLPEDLHAATANLTTVGTSDLAPPPPLRYASSNTSSYSSRPAMTSYVRPEVRLNNASSSSYGQSDKCQSAPPQSNHSPNNSSSLLNSGLRSAAVAPSLNNRVPTKTVQPIHSSPTYSHNSYSLRPTETNLNYKALYEKEKQEGDRLRREVDDLRKQQQDSPSMSTARSMTSRYRNGSPASSLPLSKSSSTAAMDDADRRAMERKIADLEVQLKTFNQIKMENQRLKEENGALVRVISKMTI